VNYQEALEYLHSLGKFGIQPGLTRINALLQEMGNPERKFRSVHVAGTNGKGSTAAMIASILSISGIRTGLYTSPHLMEYTERISVNGVRIDQEELAEALAQTSNAALRLVSSGGEQPTEFEILTAAAFYHFAVKNIEMVVVETGLGGLLDSTNVITPEVSVITNVALDHQDRCGETVEEIAVHKAGIIKQGIPVVSAARTEALPVIIDEASKKDSRVYLLGRDFQVNLNDSSLQRQVFRFQSSFETFESLEINLLGLHQIENASLAIMTALLLREKNQNISALTIADGLKSASWPCRLEFFAGNPSVIIDGAHNPDGAKALRKSLDLLFAGKNLVFIFGVLGDKAWQEIIANLINPTDKVVVVRPQSNRAADPEIIAKEIKKTCAFVEVASTYEHGVARAKQIAGPNGLVCVAGSLYMVGHVREMIRSKEDYD